MLANVQKFSFSNSSQVDFLWKIAFCIFSNTELVNKYVIEQMIMNLALIVNNILDRVDLCNSLSFDFIPIQKIKMKYIASEGKSESL